MNYKLHSFIIQERNCLIDFINIIMTIGYNARYILDILQVMEGDTVKMLLQEPLSPTLLLPPDREGYTCVVMPMRT